MRFLKLSSVAAVVAIVVAGCGSGSTSSGVPASAGQVASGGSCKIDIAGGKTVSFTSKQDAATLQMDYWLSSDVRTTLGLAATDEGFLMNCQGGDLGSVSFFTSDGTTASAFSKGPGSYPIRAQLGTVTPESPGQVRTLIDLKDHNSWGATEAGTFTVTDLGGSRFAGNFSAKIGTTGSSPITATLTGSFDLSCINGVCS